MGPMHWVRGWGLAYGVCPWGGALVVGDLMGRHFGVGCGWFFFRALVGGGRGRGRGNSGARPAESFSQDDAGFRTAFLCYILYIEQWRFRCSMRQTVANGGPDPRGPGQTRALFGLRQPVHLVHASKTVKGLLLLVPPRTPRSRV